MLVLLAACGSGGGDPGPNAVIKTGEQARETVRAYLETKAWGFFGANCSQWLEMDYSRSAGKTGYEPGADSWELTYVRIDGRSGIAEGCDKW
jgi:hypothetical protein